ncbi:MAG: AmmeMemoRadiSam system protein A [Deltaproteobacteria bacterium]
MDVELTREEQKELLRIARAAIAAHFIGSPPPEPEISSKLLNESRGAFVTLHDKSKCLRGCIGTFMANKPLYKTILEMAIQAAFHDPRFLPLEEEELKEIQIEISVLSPLKEIKDVDEIEVGRHGIYIIKGMHCGTLLPQVAAEYCWDRNTFLEHTCMKAGLPPDGWKKDATILIYSAQVFSETK